MHSILRLTSRAPRARLFTPISNLHTQPKRFAQQSYGNDQSGHQQSDAKNPMAHLEHPGPEAPADQESKSSSSTPSQSSGSSQSSSDTQSSNDDKASSSGNKPAIYSPTSAAEKDDPEVRKHNEEMAQRSDRSVNQLSEEDNKVDKKFWKGDVGPKS